MSTAEDPVDFRKSKWKMFSCESCSSEASIFSTSAVLRRSPTDTSFQDASTNSGRLDSETQVATNVVLEAVTLENVWRVLQQINDKVTSCERKLQVLPEIQAKVDLLEKQNSTLIQEMKTLSDDYSGLKLENAELKDRILQLERYSRIKNLVIKGIPAAENDNLYSAIMKVAKHIKSSEVVITDFHRLSTKPESPVIVVFQSHSQKNDFLYAAIKMKIFARNVFSTAQDDKRIFVYEHLCKDSMELYMRAKANSEQLNFYQVFSRNGFIYCKNEKGGRRHLIKDKQQLLEMLEAKDLRDAYVAN